MLANRARTCCALFVTISWSCTSAFKVSEGSKPKGLPFYVKSMVYRHHSLYEHSWVRVALSFAPAVDGASGPEETGARTTMVREVQDDAASLAAIKSLQARVADLPHTPLVVLRDTLLSIRTAFNALPSVPPQHLSRPSGSDLRLSGNYVERIAIVDYTKRYYLNAKVPFFGSNSLAADLAADGTLAKSSSSGTGGGSEAIAAIAGAVTGVLPIKEWLSAKWVPTTAENAALQSGNQQSVDALRALPDPKTKSVRVELAVETQSVTYDFVSDSTHPPSGQSLKPVASDFDNGLFTMRVAEKPGEKGAENAINFSGKVQLPPAKQP